MQASGPSGPKNDINVTPLVDVVLVLLIIFMVITPMLQKGAPVELPLTDHPIKAKSIDEQITISIDKQGGLFLENDPIDESALAQKLSTVYSTMPTTPIFVKGDNGAPYGRVRTVMKLVQDAGFPRVGVITKETKEGA
jgi:biopolymer transport protein TolR